MNELLQPECDQDLPPSPSVSAVPACTQCDAGTQVMIFPERKNARIQTQVRTKTTGIVIIICKFYDFCYHYYGYFLIGSQVRPSVRSVGIQCYFGDDKSLTQAYSVLSSHLLLPSKVSQRNLNRKCPNAAMISLVILIQVAILLKMKAHRKFVVHIMQSPILSIITILYISELSLHPSMITTLIDATSCLIPC